MKSIPLEICCYTENSALSAQKYGASRIEYCSKLLQGGLTPSTDSIIRLRKKISIPFYCIIRPRGGNFIYSKEEFLTIRQSLLEIKLMGVDGFVLGLLNSNSQVEKSRCLELVELAYPLPLTFHKAFDEVNNPFEALEDLVQLGFSKILSSGQRNTALEGKVLLRELIKKAGDRITVMPGGGIRFSNIQEILEFTNASEIHSSAISINNLEQADPKEIQKMVFFLNPG